jgi:hypothetical protein
MEKLYKLSEHNDREVEDAVSAMSEIQLRVALYGIARGWGFDESMDIAIFTGLDKSDWQTALNLAPTPRP